jgi:hypothetical protein
MLGVLVSGLRGGGGGLAAGELVLIAILRSIPRLRPRRVALGEEEAVSRGGRLVSQRHHQIIPLVAF